MAEARAQLVAFQAERAQLCAALPGPPSEARDAGDGGRYSLSKMCQVLQRMGLQRSLSTKVEGVVAEIREAVATAEGVKQEEAERAEVAKA
eukprot:9382259-Pyramimonas_sp.AAC.1